MKDFWSLIVATVRKCRLIDYIAAQSKTTHLVWLIIAVSLLSIINSCSLSASTDSEADREAAIVQQKHQDVTEIEDNIENSYARLAAQHPDICPKLIQKDIDNNEIQRLAEVMVNNYCDYFLYLRTGQNIMVSVDNNQIDALLIVPVLHDFANGAYEVTSYDKHVIRLSYNGASYKPERLSYNVTINISD
ncbi:hypothetical protein [Psychrobacter sp. CAL346-MNA-CIBAN-0220]|uniref:hypothetical protein n=1 Tax=Psychrobacter sp. CAL346-MNA-CIBAN-0220 TaxID=3140457 RepID=UPI003316D4B7